MEVINNLPDSFQFSNEKVELHHLFLLVGLVQLGNCIYERPSRIPVTMMRSGQKDFMIRQNGGLQILLQSHIQNIRRLCLITAVLYISHRHGSFSAGSLVMFWIGVPPARGLWSCLQDCSDQVRLLYCFCFLNACLHTHVGFIWADDQVCESLEGNLLPFTFSLFKDIEEIC